MEEVISDYNQAIRFDKNEANYFIARDICYFDMEQNDNAMKDYRQAAKLGSNKARDFLKSKNISWE